MLGAKTLDPDLVNTMESALPGTLHEVIIRFDGQNAISDVQLDAHLTAGINTVISMRNLPIVGASATTEKN